MNFIPDPSIFTDVINSYLPEPQAALLNGILFGINLSKRGIFYQELKMVGLLHLVVLSGINITLLGALIGSITKRLSKKVSILITILIIILFIIFVGPQAPIIRAGFMGVLTLVSVIYGRKTVALYLLLLSALFIGLFWPEWLGTISFQLSYGATLGIILFGQVKIKRSENLIDEFKQDVYKDFKTSIAAQIFTAPIIFYYFKQISLIAPLANLLVSFTIPPLMIFGFATAILGKIHPLLGWPTAIICYGLLSYITFIVEFLAKLPYVFFSF